MDRRVFHSISVSGFYLLEFCENCEFLRVIEHGSVNHGPAHPPAPPRTDWLHLLFYISQQLLLTLQGRAECYSRDCMSCKGENAVDP